MFSICGARGELSETPDGPPVDYDYGGSLADIIYYYSSSGSVFLYVRLSLSAHSGPYTILLSPESCIFVDSEVLNEQMTSTSLTDHSYKFREDIIQRDGSFCIITDEDATHCDAAHLIPRCKGDEVTSIVQSM